MPPRYRHVLVAYDGSADAELALEQAVALAQGSRARLLLVSVVPPPPPLNWQVPSTVDPHEAVQAEAGARLRAAADRVPDDIPLTTRLLNGDPAHELLRAAGASDADVIAMGSRGRGRVATALLGSVSNHVMHHAGVPVIVVHRPRGGDGPDLAA